MPKVVYYVDNDENSLTHYGRLGMKWGQHIYGRDETGHKVLRKLSKYDKKALKYSLKYIKADKKAKAGASAKIRTDFSVEKFRRNSEKMKKYEALTDKQVQKAIKLVKNANEVLGTSQLSKLSERDIELGERYSLEFAKEHRYVVSPNTGNQVVIKSSRK